jgi:hypothetical protein
MLGFSPTDTLSKRLLPRFNASDRVPEIRDANGGTCEGPGEQRAGRSATATPDIQ